VIFNHWVSELSLIDIANPGRTFSARHLKKWWICSSDAEIFILIAQANYTFNPDKNSNKLKISPFIVVFSRKTYQNSPKFSELEIPPS
jgi:hypothetical protein